MVEIVAGQRSWLVGGNVIGARRGAYRYGGNRWARPDMFGCGGAWAPRLGMRGRVWWPGAWRLRGGLGMVSNGPGGHEP